MRRLSTSWTETLCKLGLNRASMRRTHKQAANRASSLGLEALEDRRMMAVADGLMRVVSTPFPEQSFLASHADLSAHASDEVSYNSSYNVGETLASSGAVASAGKDGAFANGVAGAADARTPVPFNSTTAIASLDLTNAVVAQAFGSDEAGASVRLDTYAAGVTEWEVQDTGATEYWLHAFVFVSGVGGFTGDGSVDLGMGTQLSVGVSLAYAGGGFGASGDWTPYGGGGGSGTAMGTMQTGPGFRFKIEGETSTSDGGLDNVGEIGAGIGESQTANLVSTGVAWAFITDSETLLDGDIDFDDDVDEDDIATVIEHFGQNVAMFDGDANRDGIVDEDDFELVAGNANLPGVIWVTTEDDEADGVGNSAFLDVSLREAIAEADAAPGANIIRFAPWVHQIYLDATLGNLTIDSDVAVDGPGADILTINANGDSDFAYDQRAFHVLPGVSASLRDFTVTGAINYVDKGGAIYSEGYLTIEDMRINGNEGRDGVGIYQEGGSLTMIRTEVKSNLQDNTTGDGGAVVLDHANSATIHSSSITNNTSAAGSPAGGLLVRGGGETRILNTTIAANYSDQSLAAGVAIIDNADVIMVNATVAKNTSSEGGTGGIYVENSSGSTATLYNTLVGGNTVDGSTDDVAGAFNGASDYNLIGNTIGSIGLTGGNSYTNLDPKLGPLAYNGGNGMTILVKQTSLAIDNGSNAKAAEYLDYALYGEYDQRGEDREVNWDTAGSDTVDIGAVEHAFGEFYDPPTSPW